MCGTIDRIDELYRHERYLEARQVLGEVAASDGASTEHLEIWRARLDLVGDEVCVDEVILRLGRLLSRGGPDDEGRAAAWELLAAGYLKKRLASLARDAVSRGRAALGDRATFDALEAAAALVEDDRASARALLGGALGRDPEARVAPALDLAPAQVGLLDDGDGKAAVDKLAGRMQAGKAAAENEHGFAVVGKADIVLGDRGIVGLVCLVA